MAGRTKKQQALAAHEIDAAVLRQAASAADLQTDLIATALTLHRQLVDEGIAADSGVALAKTITFVRQERDDIAREIIGKAVEPLGLKLKAGQVPPLPVEVNRRVLSQVADGIMAVGRKRLKEVQAEERRKRLEAGA